MNFIGTSWRNATLLVLAVMGLVAQATKPSGASANRVAGIET
ncbi:MAG TPA: hypothetical protein PLL88_03375 [Anaerolineaceae bacterium]|nr:hypothetical protein [Anaerolineaceae bacterium]